MAAAVIPGTRLGSISEFSAGDGTYVSGDDVIASVVGFQRVRNAETNDQIVRVALCGPT